MPAHHHFNFVEGSILCYCGGSLVIFLLGLSLSKNVEGDTHSMSVLASMSISCSPNCRLDDSSTFVPPAFGSSGGTSSPGQPLGPWLL